jgi:hypothetical protein
MAHEGVPNHWEAHSLQLVGKPDTGFQPFAWAALVKEPFVFGQGHLHSKDCHVQPQHFD